jgi:tryptophanyl-tRNA synthetase
VEVTQDLAGKVNRAFGEVFVIPQASVLAAVATVPGLDGQKMSKSHGNAIALFEEEKALRKKVMGIKTDSTPVESPKDPEGSVIVALYKLVASDTEVAEMEAEFRAGGRGYGDFKKMLFDRLMDYFAPMRARRTELERDPAYVEKVLKHGAERAGAVADQVLSRVRQAMGFRAHPVRY